MERPSLTKAASTLFSAVERVVLFALSLSVGLVNLLIGLVLAAHLGVIPKSLADRVIGVSNRAAAFVEKVMGSPSHAARKRKTRGKTP